MNKYYCKDCGEEIYINTYLYGTKRCHSCAMKHNIKQYGHPMSGKQHTKITKIKISQTKLNDDTQHGTQHCVDCKKDLKHQKREVQRCNGCARKYQYATRPETHPWFRKFGKEAPNYINGEGHAPYPVDFNNDLKELIRKRDNYICQRCKKNGNHVHHINYIKDNCKNNNLITLCRECNLSVNANRDYWFAYFTYLIGEYYGY